MTALLRRRPRPARCALDGLQHLKALELRVAEIKRLVVAGAAMRGAERFRLRPGGESLLVRPHRMRGIERMVLLLGPAQEVEFDKARHALQMRVTRKPDVLE